VAGEPEAVKAARAAARSGTVGVAGRVGLAAQGVCFGLIGVLAIALAAGEGGKATDPQGAFNALARGGWTRVLLIALTFGFACYALWRFSQALLDRGGMGTGVGGLGRRGIQFVQGSTYLLLTIGAGKTVFGAGARAGTERRAAAGILGWPGGREIIGFVALVLLATGVVTVYWGVSGRFRESLALDGASRGMRQAVQTFGVVGLCSLGTVLVIVAWFLGKAAYEFDKRAAVGIGGALAKLAHASYGPILLSAVAFGLIVFGLFDLLQARYHQA
jgi:hypothetical protein